MRTRQDGLADRLDAQDKRLAELSRSGVRGSPLLIVRLAVNVATWNADQINVVPVSAWSPTPEFDNRTMWRYNTGSGTYAELPCAGRFRIFVTTKWAAPGFETFDASRPNAVSTSILVNGTDPVANGVAETTAYMLPQATTAYEVTCEDRVFQHGDRIRVNFWSFYSKPTLLARALNTWTHLLVRYVGPE